MEWFGEDFDKSLLVVGAIFITSLLIFKVLGLHDDDGNSIVSPELIMALIQIPNTMISVAVGKKWGEVSRK